MLKKIKYKSFFSTLIVVVFYMLNSDVTFATTYNLLFPEKILILASYDSDNLWERSVINGFKSNLDENTLVKTEFLDTKINSSEDYKEGLVNLLNIKYGNDGIDCIVALDDEAFNIARSNLFNEDTFFYKKPIIFIGVNEYVSLSFEENQYITGIMEYQDNLLMIDTILDQNKNIEDIYVLLDKSIYSQTIKDNLKKVGSIASRPFNAHIIEYTYLNDVLNSIEGINKNTSALYLCGTYMRENNISIPSEYIISSIKETSKSPLYAKLLHYVEAGAIGGIINDGYKLGETAADILYRFLEVFKESSVMPIYRTYNTSIFNYKVMKEYKINPLKLPNNTIYINKGPFDLLLPQYLINIIYIIVGTLLAFIIILLLSYRRSRKRAQKNRLLLVEAEERHKVRTDFIITLSHELRTPLNIILSSSSLLIQKSKQEQFKSSLFIEKLNFITNNANRLLRYINNIIDSSKLEFDYIKLSLKNSNIVYLVEEVTLATIKKAESYNLNVVFNTEEEEIITAIDEEKLCKVIAILLSNAIKFSKEYGEIYVNVKRVEDKAVIEIKDNGIGISEINQLYIFDRFKREQSVSSLKVNQEGSGIGLYIAKGFIELHNGSISVTSEIDKGSTFIIKLPIVIENQGNEYINLSNEELNHIVSLELSDI